MKPLIATVAILVALATSAPVQAQTPELDELRARGKRRQIMMGRLGGGVAVAVALAVLMGVPSIGGIATWKWALALAGFALFVWGGLSDRQNSR